MNKQPVHDPVLTPIEEASLKAMSLEEVRLLADSEHQALRAQSVSLQLAFKERDLNELFVCRQRSGVLSCRRQEHSSPTMRPKPRGTRESRAKSKADL